MIVITKDEFWNYTDDLVTGMYLNPYKAQMLVTGLRNIRNLLLMMTNTDDEIRFNKGLQTLCEMSKLMDQAFNLKG